jgi:amicyanin
MRATIQVSLLVLFGVLGVVLGGCSSSRTMHDGAMRAPHDAMHGVPPSQPAGPAFETLSVAIENFAFTPPTIQVKPGATVRWTNRDAAPHTVTFRNAPFKSELLTQNQSWSQTFSQAGTFSYFCEPHPWMTGQVIVTIANP